MTEVSPLPGQWLQRYPPGPWVNFRTTYHALDHRGEEAEPPPATVEGLQDRVDRGGAVRPNDEGRPSVMGSDDFSPGVSAGMAGPIHDSGGSAREGGEVRGGPVALHCGTSSGLTGPIGYWGWSSGNYHISSGYVGVAGYWCWCGSFVQDGTVHACASGGGANAMPITRQQSAPHKCPICDGKGKVRFDPAEPLRRKVGEFDCRPCSGTGIIWGV